MNPQDIAHKFIISSYIRENLHRQTTKKNLHIYLSGFFLRETSLKSPLTGAFTVSSACHFPLDLLQIIFGVTTGNFRRRVSVTETALVRSTLTEMSCPL